MVNNLYKKIENHIKSFPEYVKFRTWKGI